MLGSLPILGFPDLCADLDGFSLHAAIPRHVEAFARHLSADLSHAVDTEILGVHTADLRAKLGAFTDYPCYKRSGSGRINSAPSR